MTAKGSTSIISEARLPEDKKTHDAKLKKHEFTDVAAQTRQDIDKPAIIAQPKYLPKPETPFDVEVVTSNVPPSNMTSDSKQLQKTTKVRYRPHNFQQ